MARLGVVVDYSSDFAEAAADVVQFEKFGVEQVSVSEAYSFDAVSKLGYLAAVTERITLATGILPLYSRTPTLIAMTAAGLDSLSGGRFELGIGTSGPQVIEGFHGVPFDAPLGRTRETIEICRAVWRREKIDHAGRYYSIPLPVGEGTGLGKPLKLINRPLRPGIPITVAALTPKSVAQAAEIADGWLPLFYYPERADLAWGAALAQGRALRDPALGALDVVAEMPLFIGDSTDEAFDEYRQRMALYVGGMGARGANFYNDLASRYGYGDEAALIQELYLTGQKAEAAAAVPDDLVRSTALIGTESEVRLRMLALLDSGVTTILVQPLGGSRTTRLSAVEAAQNLLASLA
ncbi:MULTISPECIES: LLM class F420-dependent oxidoreductase [Subtercola]|uniref:LLM class F420-dependent oxidoreductase n=1 Tax=Subtercola vilae TaxID=2056433 RepID=A0A4T2C827_9MICO|nr:MULTISPECIES: LLM class F420-dependent oxidoreductase [Subtercola]MEA9984387.1 LLM class F420-dependent oxidoreductase [Subtercola sp. RTI3]TIH40049.1 LLM class F420-dependent oxidoreductase [Subtercola vilae]